MITNKDLMVRIQPDGINIVLMEFLCCRLNDGRMLRGTIGSTSDGMSGGKLIKAVLQDKHTFLEAVFHDCCFRNTIEESKDLGKTWAAYSPTFEESNDWLKENILSAGGSEVESQIIWLGVSGPEGRKAFNQDRGLD
ncbi:MAG: hypothetical protein KGL39_43610 [Patescibacteria group bacterium]|nr:hypothetical protein [Patescibacteria group bacterium]